jgi:Tol biopolymer transport system component
VFSSDRANPGQTLDLWIMNADGSNPVQITDDPGWDRRADWS